VRANVETDLVAEVRSGPTGAVLTGVDPLKLTSQSRRRDMQHISCASHMHCSSGRMPTSDHGLDC
jgi:hypothetical protein